MREYIIRRLLLVIPSVLVLTLLIFSMVRLVPGDVVEIERGTVILNGEELDEPYLERGDRSNMDAQTVPPDSYFVLGDNRRASNDSRDWGFVPSEQIVGRAWFGYWPFDQIRSLLAFRLPQPLLSSIVSCSAKAFSRV